MGLFTWLTGNREAETQAELLRGAEARIEQLRGEMADAHNRHARASQRAETTIKELTAELEQANKRIKTNDITAEKIQLQVEKERGRLETAAAKMMSLTQSLRESQARSEELEKQVVTRLAEVAQTEQKIKKLSAESTALKSELSKAQALGGELRASNAEKAKSIRSLESALTKSQEQASELQQSVEDLQVKHRSLLMKVQLLEAEAEVIRKPPRGNHGTEKRIKTSDITAEKIQLQLEEERGRLETAAAKMMSLTQSLRESQARSEELEKQVVTRLAEVAQTEKKIKKLSAESTALKSELSRAQALGGELKASNAEKAKFIRSLESALTKSQEQASELQQSVEDLQAKHRGLLMKVQLLEAEAEVIRQPPRGNHGTEGAPHDQSGAATSSGIPADEAREATPAPTEAKQRLHSATPSKSPHTEETKSFHHADSDASAGDDFDDHTDDPGISHADAYESESGRQPRAYDVNELVDSLDDEDDFNLADDLDDDDFEPTPVALPSELDEPNDTSAVESLLDEESTFADDMGPLESDRRNDKTDALPRERRAEQVALDLVNEYALPISAAGTLTKIFTERWWSSTKRAVISLLDRKADHQEIALCYQIRNFWSVTEAFSCYFSESGDPRERNVPLPWLVAFEFIRAYQGRPDLAELETYLVESFEAWRSRPRRYLAYRSYLLYLKAILESQEPGEALPAPQTAGRLPI